MKRNIDELIFLGCMLFLPMVVMAWFFWKGFRRRYPEKQFQIRITDLWALTIGFAPGFYFLSTANETDKYIHASAVIVGQVLGAFYAQLKNEASRNESSKHNSFAAGINVFVGAIFGIFLPYVGMIGFVVLIAVGLKRPGFVWSLFSFEGRPKVRAARRPVKARVATPIQAKKPLEQDQSGSMK